MKLSNVFQWAASGYLALGSFFNAYANATYFLPEMDLNEGSLARLALGSVFGLLSGTLTFAGAKVAMEHTIGKLNWPLGGAADKPVTDLWDRMSFKNQGPK